MTRFCALPLQIARILGFTFALFGFSIRVYVGANFLFYGSAAPGCAFPPSIIAMFSGAQLLALGVIGEYLARMHFRTMDRPTYLVSDAVSYEDTDDWIRRGAGSRRGSAPRT